MKGTTINNKEIIKLISEGFLKINPFDNTRLQIAQYPLSPKSIWEVKSENVGEKVYDFSSRETSFNLKPKTFYWIEIYESIKVSKGIVGRFIPASILIEKGLNLVYGKIEYPYGENGEKIKFGLFNYLDVSTSLKFDERIAYIEFIDLRGFENDDYIPTKYDENIYELRREMDDGVNYEKYDDE